MITNEVMKWLKAHAYVGKDGEYWFLTDFDMSKKPDKLEIPVTKPMWRDIQELLAQERAEE